MYTVSRIVAVMALMQVFILGTVCADDFSVDPTPRTFDFSYSVQLEDIALDAQSIRVWIPMPQSSAGQTVSGLKVEGPGAMRIVTETKYDNQILHFEVPVQASAEPLRATYRVTRTVRSALDGSEKEISESTDLPRHFLLPSRYIAIEGPVEMEARAVAGDITGSVNIARKLYDNIVSTVRYDKSGQGWGRGDSLYACDAREGNCTDFHSLFIGEARALNVPTRFVMGFSVPNEAASGTLGGSHCWAEFYSKDLGWVPLDASDAFKRPERREFLFGNLDQNRVRFTTGRDITLPGMQGEPLNYLIYPYVEVDGEVHTAMKTTYSYIDVE